MELFADTLSTKIAPRYIALIPTTAKYNGVGARKINPLPITLEYLTAQGAGPGTVVGEALPGQIAGLISRRTNVAGKSARGRLYVPWPTEGDNTPDGLPSAQYGNRVALLSDDLLAPVTIVGGADQQTFYPTVWSRKLRQGNVVTKMVLPLRWATQRRRGSFGAPNISPV